MRALVFGAGGRLGRALVGALGERLAFAAGRADADVTDALAVASVVDSVRPDVIFNATAYNGVDAAETEVAEALAGNAAAPRHIAVAALRANAVVVHVSTNYVFDGAKPGFYTEEDLPRPQTAYGISKRAGERLVEVSGADYILARTSAVFGHGGSHGKPASFVTRVLEAARRGETLTIVDDQTICATYAKDLAEVLVTLAERGARGSFHVTNSGATTWHNLAQTAVDLAGIQATIRPIKTAELATAARRPLNSPISSVRLAGAGIPPLRPWQDALKEFLTA